MRQILCAAFAALLASNIAAGQVIYQDMKLVANDGAPRDQFGRAVAIADGVVAVGAHQAAGNGSDSGAIYLFDATTGSELRKIVPEKGRDCMFGWAVAYADGVLAASKLLGNVNQRQCGSAFLIDGATGQEQLKLSPPDPNAAHFFGYSMAMEEGVLLIGARGDNTYGEKAGAAHVFDATSGLRVRELVPVDIEALDRFGEAVALSADLAVVAAPHDFTGGISGSVYLFDITSGAQVGNLTPAVPDPNYEFGTSVAIAGRVVAVGAHHYIGDYKCPGKAYLFDAVTDTQTAEFYSDGLDSNDCFGESIAVSDDVVVVGAPNDDVVSRRSGSAYAFDIETGLLIAKLLPDDGEQGGRFGMSVAIDGRTVVVGAPFDWDYSGNGAVYVFTVPCLGDISGDGAVDSADLNILLGNFGTPDGMTLEDGDIDADGDVDSRDLSILLTKFGDSC